MGKYHNNKAIFLHQITSICDQLDYESDITKYFAFNTVKEAQNWFNMWLIGNKPQRSLQYYSIQEIKPGINTLGYISQVQPDNTGNY